MAYKFQIKKDKRGEFRVNFVAPNGQIMYSTAGYPTKSSATTAIESIKKNGPDAVVEEVE
jgi:uncharacterized protein YegP (UPF0339 family)